MKFLKRLQYLFLPKSVELPLDINKSLKAIGLEEFGVDTKITFGKLLGSPVDENNIIKPPPKASREYDINFIYDGEKYKGIRWD